MIVKCLFFDKNKPTKNKHTTRDNIREWVSTIPEAGDNNALTHCNSGSISMASKPSSILRPSTPFSFPRIIKSFNFGTSEDLVATMSLPICLWGTSCSEQYLYNNSLPLAQKIACNSRMFNYLTLYTEITLKPQPSKIYKKIILHKYPIIGNLSIYTYMCVEQSWIFLTEFLKFRT